jgi:glycine/D-amino acid oxidase-like deaminating enzyme
MGSANGATRRRDLRTATPVWLARGMPRIPCTPLADGSEADVAIVGAGVSGALIADALLQAGKTVAVLDRRGPVRGSTAASTALLQFELDQPLSLLVAKIGRARAVRAYWRSTTAVDYLRGRVADLGLRCRFKERRTVYLPGNVLDVAGLRAEAALRAEVGLRSRFIDRDQLQAMTGIDRAGAILSGGAAEADPVAMVAALWRSALERGCRMHAPVEVTEIATTRRGVTLATAGGQEIRASHAVFATGYELVKLMRSRGHKVISTWAMATEPQSERLWPSRCLIWEAADPYLYLRTTADGRIVVGGEDEPFADDERRDALIPQKIATIAAKLGKLLPGVATEPAFAWAGCFGESSTGLPTIGRIPGAERCFVVMGYGGNGITFSAVAAQIIQREILAVPDADAELFALPR